MNDPTRDPIQALARMLAAMDNKLSYSAGITRLMVLGPHIVAVLRAAEDAPLYWKEHEGSPGKRMYGALAALHAAIEKETT